MATLEAKLDYSFKTAGLLDQALTHRSHSSLNNERLEFLGDSILNFVIAAAVFAQFPDASEGDLSRLRAGLVKQSTLADVARDIDLGGYLTMGSGELKSGGFERDSILSDALEAIVGAVYLDSGFDSAARCVTGLFETRLRGLSADDLKKDAKSKLQEFLQGLGEPVPEYVLVSTRGKSPHQVFEIECRSVRFSSPVRASGSSRRKAEQNAAALGLEALGQVP